MRQMARPVSDEELQLKRRARRRLIGAIVLVTAIVVALPMLLDTEPKPLSGEVSIKMPSPDSSDFTSRVVPVAPPGDLKSAPASKLSTEMKSAPKAAAPAEKAAAVPASKPAAQSEKAAASPAAEKSAKASQAEASAQPAAAAKKPPAKQPAGPPFIVQVIALADVEKAKQVQAQIAAAGIKSYTEIVKTAKGDVTRVRAGPFATREAAEKAREQLKAIGFSGNVASK